MAGESSMDLIYGVAVHVNGRAPVSSVTLVNHLESRRAELKERLEELQEIITACKERLANEGY